MWTPGPAELRVLRARVPRAPDGRRARRGLRPRRPRRRPATCARRAGWSACTPSTAASTTTSSTRSSSAPDSMLGVPGPRARLPRGHRRDRQRARHRRRGRQGRLPLRAGDDPLLPRRGAAAGERRHVPAHAIPSSSSTCSAHLDELVVKPTGESGGKGVSIGPTATDAELARLADAVRAQPRALDRAGGREALDRADGRPRRRGSRRGTWTCGRSRSSASGSTSCPAASRASRWRRAR